MENNTVVIVCSLIGTIWAGILSYLMARLNAEQKKNTVITNQTHALVNSSSRLHLNLTATLARRLALLTKLPEDFEVANQAEIALRLHDGRQIIADQLVPFIASSPPQEGKPK